MNEGVPECGSGVSSEPTVEELWTHGPPGFKAFGLCTLPISSRVYDMLFPLSMEKTGCHAFRHLIDLFFLMKVMKVACPPISLAISHSTTYPTQVVIQIQRAFPKCLLCVGVSPGLVSGKPGQVGPAARLLCQQGL